MSGSGLFAGLTSWLAYRDGLAAHLAWRREDLPILADLLEDAGCNWKVLLEGARACRQWVQDLVLRHPRPWLLGGHTMGEAPDELLHVVLLSHGRSQDVNQAAVWQAVGPRPGTIWTMTVRQCFAAEGWKSLPLPEDRLPLVPWHWFNCLLSSESNVQQVEGATVVGVRSSNHQFLEHDPGRGIWMPMDLQVWTSSELKWRGVA